jgi:glycosyltransferase involved in cell wall biosynthesis
MTIKALFIGNYAIPLHNIRPEAEMIIGLKQRGLDVEVMTRRDCYYARHMETFGIRIHDFAPARKFSWEAVRTIRKVLREGQHHVVHLFNNRTIANGVWAAIGLPVKVVTYRGQTGNISRFDPSCYLTHLHPRVDKIVCVANAVRDDLRRQLFDESKPVTIYKGHDIRWYQNTAAKPRAALDVPDDAFLVGCVANNRPRKGVPVLIEAAKRLPPDLPIFFLLAGRDMDESSLAIVLGNHAVRSRCRMLGHRDDVLELVASCDATVLPALKREGLPKTVIESMALGVTPVVTRTGGNPELVVDGQCGLVVPPGDPAALAEALMSLYRDRARNQAMAAAARERIATEFTLEKSIGQHDELYQSLCRSANS